MARWCHHGGKLEPGMGVVSCPTCCDEHFEATIGNTVRDWIDRGCPPLPPLFSVEPLLLGGSR
jgi:hypothetical protein